MHSIRPAVFHTAQPVGGRQWRIQLAKIQSSSANERVRVSLFHRDIVRVLKIVISGGRVQG